MISYEIGIVKFSKNNSIRLFLATINLINSSSNHISNYPSRPTIAQE
jgi:hypothetical protein